MKKIVLPRHDTALDHADAYVYPDLRMLQLFAVVHETSSSLGCSEVSLPKPSGLPPVEEYWGDAARERIPERL